MDKLPGSSWKRSFIAVVTQLFSPSHEPALLAPRNNLSTWELAILKSIRCQPTLWPAWHADTQRLQQLGLVRCDCGMMILTWAGHEAIRQAEGASH